MKTLLFKNNIHNTVPVEIPGHNAVAVNLTVRKGLKWSDIQVGEEVEIRETGNEVDAAQIATIWDVKVIRFVDLQEYAHMLKLEHDPDCQTFQGLFKVMKKVYDGFSLHELVTLVFYVPQVEEEVTEETDED